MTELNKRIADIPIPSRLAGFPLSDEGYPVPYFVPFIDGRPEFRAMDLEKFTHAVRNRRCWLCGGQLGKFLTFPIGPMCAITRTTAEPPSHLECAEYAVRACPFLSQPRMRRNEKDLPDSAGMAGIGIKRNPGVTVLWTTLGYKLFSASGGKGYLFRIGDPEHVEAYALGRIATTEELAHSVITGYPILQATATQDGPEAEDELTNYYAAGLRVLGLRPELMYTIEREAASEDHRSGNGGTSGSEDALTAQSGSPGEVSSPTPQPQRGPEVLDQQGERGPGHPIQAGPAGQDGGPVAQPGGGRHGLLAQGARRVQVGSQRVAARAMAVYRKIHSTRGPD
jgi:hypothetical protein